jgi:asparaginyl-tRNA synthetase
MPIISAADDDATLSKLDPATCKRPEYSPTRHYLDVAGSGYFHCLTLLRHHIKTASDAYFSGIGAKNVDLFMLTPSVSSPMGPGSNSEPVPIKFGNLTTYLVDSSQFGFEPLMLNGIGKAYCYLPSMRGEDPDARHLNQFYHCEYEAVGDLDHVMEMAEGYVKALGAVCGQMPNAFRRLSDDPAASASALERLTASDGFRRLRFDEAVSLLEGNGLGNLVARTPHGQDISAQGEAALMRLLEADAPVWLTHYHRDRVPFYQKPDPSQPDRVLNADLLFPALVEGSFAGEIVGSGQRQDGPEEMLESMRRQGVDPGPYEWYSSLRSLPGYRTTSGFGLGIERFIAWALCLASIRDAILYPRLKNVHTLP